MNTQIMKTYTVRLVHTAYVEYTIEASSEDDANNKVWEEFDRFPPEPDYGDWEIADIGEKVNP